MLTTEVAVLSANGNVSKNGSNYKDSYKNGNDNNNCYKDYDNDRAPPPPPPSKSRLGVRAFQIFVWYACNTLHNVYNKKSMNMMNSHGCVACAFLAVGIIWTFIMWMTGIRSAPNVSASDIAMCIPIGICASFAHLGSCFSSAIGAVSFSQIVKACEPVFAAVVGLLITPMDVKPILAYLMLIPIIVGVGLVCIKEGKGVDINVTAFMYASMANVAAALKGKFGSGVTKTLKGNREKNMDSANVFAVTNILSFLFAFPYVLSQELPILAVEYNKAVETHGLQALVINIGLAGFFYYVYNEFAFAFTAEFGAVTSSVLNTAKRVIIIVVSTIVFDEPMERNTVIGSTIAIFGTFGYSLASIKNNNYSNYNNDQRIAEDDDDNKNKRILSMTKIKKEL